MKNEMENILHFLGWYLSKINIILHSDIYYYLKSFLVSNFYFLLIRFMIKYLNLLIKVLYYAIKYRK